MICIECGNPEIQRLYSEYKNSYITLTICSKCNNVADKYIEYDNVLLFIDLLLLKPQAYRHLAFNLTEEQLLANVNGSRFQRYHLVIRLFMIFILFDVYLIWAHEERKPFHSPAMQILLTQPVYLQYLFFILRLVGEIAGHSFLMLSLCDVFTKWGENVPQINIPRRLQRGYMSAVLLIVLLVSNSIKLFPILMLIWPYDASTESLFIINIIAFITSLEAVSMTIGASRWRVFVLSSTAAIMRLLVSTSFTALCAHFLSDQPVLSMLLAELAQVVPKGF